MTDNMDEKKCCSGGKIWKDGKCVLPEVTFATFIMSLNTSALYHLGEIKDPVTGKQEKDLLLVKHTIDTLDLLQKKTKDNLTHEEVEMLGNILYDLRLRFIKASS